MSINVLNPGLATSVQDAGREGYYHLGIPPAGALDQYAMRAANLLVGNQPTDAVLECTLLGPKLEFQRDTLVAVSGGRMTPRVDGLEMPFDTAFRVSKGQILSFDYLKAGARGYLAIAGGIDVPEVLGSRSTYTLGGIGGISGRRLIAGDVIPLGQSSGRGVEGATLPRSMQTELGGEVELRVVPGLYYHRLLAQAAESFFADIWTVGSEADRMGYRFKGGSALGFEAREQPFGAGSDPSNIVDACYPIGSIQVPAGIEPIALHRDAVSGGGYAMIGTVISPDLNRIAQLQPNQKVRFVAVTLEEGLLARKQYNQQIERMLRFFNSQS